MELTELLSGAMDSLGDALLFLTLIIVLILIWFSLKQAKRYSELSKSVNLDLQKVKEQETAVKKLEEDLREYVMGGRSLRDWKVVKQQVDDLSGLPSFIDNGSEYVLRIHMSMTKKDGVRVNGEKSGINISVESKDAAPLNSFYSMPKEIDPSRLKVTYKGDSLEVVAPKLSLDKQPGTQQGT